MIADELDPVIIESEVIGSPQPEITWLLDDMKLNEDNRHRMSYDGRVAMLVVRRVTTQDSGRIQCVAENSSGKVSADCMLVVRGKMLNISELFLLHNDFQDHNSLKQNPFGTGN